MEQHTALAIVKLRISFGGVVERESGRRRRLCPPLEAVPQHLVQKLKLDLALDHVHALLAQVVDHVKDKILSLVQGDGAGINLAEKVVQRYKGARSADTSAAYITLADAPARDARGTNSGQSAGCADRCSFRLPA
jgi:hypothetical protein